MPGPYTYPGVYVEEIPSGVRTIVGVSTSDTAFVDTFKRGPINKATRITGPADFDRIFGGADPRSEASYAIQQYFINGGQTAWVVRVETTGDARASFDLQGSSPPQTVLTVEAASPGAWGDNLRVAVAQVLDDGQPVADRFTLLVREVALVDGAEQIVTSETHRNLSMNTNDGRYALKVIEASSALVRLTANALGGEEIPVGVTPDALGNVPNSAFTPLDGGQDGGTPSGNDLLGKDAVGQRLVSKAGIYALDEIEPFVFNILCLPAAANLDDEGAFPQAPLLGSVVSEAKEYCRGKRAFLIVDVPEYVKTQDKMIQWINANNGVRDRYAAVYFPRLDIPDVRAGGRARNVAASGTLAGVYARTDAQRGVWKAPAGTDADLRNATPAAKLNDLENGHLNQIGVNVLRTFPLFGSVSWGARTLRGADQMADEYKYIPIRRTASFIEESLYQGLKWVVFEPNDESLWAQIRLNVGAFMNNLFRQGAFQGRTPREAYFVKCDKETTTQNDINLGIVNIVVGFAPLKPAEFVVIKLQQITGQVET